MAAFDFSASFAGINQGINALGQGLERQWQRQRYAEIGDKVKAGDLNGAASSLLALGDIGNAAAFLKLGQAEKERQLGQEAVRGLGTAIGGLGFGGLPPLGQGASAPTATGSALPAALNSSESGGNWQAQNNEVGAGGAVGHFGRAQFGQARLQEAAAAGAIPQGTTPQQFMQSPELQKAAENWHFADIDQAIRANGYDRLIGQSINGVPITADGLRAVAHLGGKQGLQRFIETRGQYNPRDANGTSLMDYLRLGAGSSGVRTAAADAPAPGAANASLDTGTQGFAVPGQPSMTGRTFDAITSGGQGLQPSFMAEGASQPWMGSALANLGRSAQPQRGQVLPSVRPTDTRADLPAQGAVPAIGQMPPIDRAGAVDIDPNSPDGGMRALAASSVAPQAARGGNPALVAEPDRVADLPARGAVPTQGNMPMPVNAQGQAQMQPRAADSAAPVPSSELPRPTNAQEANNYRETRAMEGRQGKLTPLISALANPNLPANARAIGEIFLKDALEQSKIPDSAKEFMYARSMGWTQAKTLSEYNAEKEKAKKNTADETVEERQAAAARAGLKPGDTGYQGYILTGKMPREDMGPLTATDKKAIMEADEGVMAAETAIKALNDAKGLSPRANSGIGAGARAWAGNMLPDILVPDRVSSPESSQATSELENVVTSQALAQLKSIFGAAPTEGERKILLDIQGSIGQPDSVRQKIYDRGIAMAQRRLEFNRQRAAELRGGDFYRSPEKRAQGGGNQPTNTQRRAGQPVRVTSPEEAYRLPKGTPIILPDGRVGEVP